MEPAQPRPAAFLDGQSLPSSAGVLKVIDMRRQKKGKQQKKGGKAQPVVTGLQALKALLPAVADVGAGAGLPSWD